MPRRTQGARKRGIEDEQNPPEGFDEAKLKGSGSAHKEQNVGCACACNERKESQRRENGTREPKTMAKGRGQSRGDQGGKR